MKERWIDHSGRYGVKIETPSQKRHSLREKKWDPQYYNQFVNERFKLPSEEEIAQRHDTYPFKEYLLVFSLGLVAGIICVILLLSYL